MKKNKVLSFKYFLCDFIRITAAIPSLIWFRPKKIYESKAAKKKIRGGALLSANHVGFMDPVYLMTQIWYRRHHFLAAKELFGANKFGKFMFKNAFLCIPVDRENFNAAAMKGIITHLKQGDLVSVFPEGHIGKSDEDLQNFKSGVAFMAYMSGCPVIPVYIKKRDNAWRRQTVVIGEPVYIDAKEKKGSSSDFMKEKTELLYQKEQRLKEIYDERCKKKK